MAHLSGKSNHRLTSGEVDYSRHESLIQLAPEIVIEMDMEVNVDVAVVVSAAVTVTVR